MRRLAAAARRAEVLALPHPPSLLGQYRVGRKHAPPTKRDLEVFLALVEHSTEDAAARALGISPHTIHAQMQTLCARIGARTRAHAAVLLYPILADRYVLPADRRLRVVA